MGLLTEFVIREMRISSWFRSDAKLFYLNNSPNLNLITGKMREELSADYNLVLNISDWLFFQAVKSFCRICFLDSETSHM